MSDKINNGELKTGSAINPKSEALLHNLSSEELDAVSGGNDNWAQAKAMMVFSQLIKEL
jgi:hypothetical protein